MHKESRNRRRQERPPTQEEKGELTARLLRWPQAQHLTMGFSATPDGLPFISYQANDTQS